MTAILALFTPFFGLFGIQEIPPPINIVEERMVSVDGAELFCRAFGSGKPVIVLHGGPGLSQEYLLPYMSRLAQNHRVIFFDQRGCGKSTAQITSETMNVETFVRDIDAVRKAFHYDQVSILGHSWGGFLAMEYAIAHPESVDKLILSNPLPASSPETAMFVEEWTHRMKPFQNTITTIHESVGFKEGDPDTIEHLHRTIFRTYCFLPEKADLLHLRAPAKASINGAKVYEELFKNVLSRSYNLHAPLKQLRLPILIVHGDADPIPPKAVESIHQSIPHSQYILMKNCGHFPYVEDPENYFKALNGFLD